jgi:hypothetical protein
MHCLRRLKGVGGWQWPRKVLEIGMGRADVLRGSSANLQGRACWSWGKAGMV